MRGNMHLYSWNVNGFRALLNGGHWGWFDKANADVVGLQEVKAELAQVPEEARQPQGYHAAWFAAAKKKGYSGVATFSRIQPLAVNFDLPDPAFQGEGRLIHLELPQFHFFNVYFPNGQMNEERLNYKLGYYDAFLAHAEELRKTKPIVVCGDFNTAHQPLDLARPKENEGTSGFLPIERAWLDRFVAAGYVDSFRKVHGNLPDMYTWWSFRSRARERNVGWRIDYFFVSEELAPKIRNAWIEPEALGSDHCPVGLALDI
ncbi:exodeoxyribonuclease III [Desulfovibrio sp. OttesenSCG-928-M16]|nr:exodeoxyribonuclease III [Desulfovibrio sp. OttesenSCG-928-M16]